MCSNPLIPPLTPTLPAALKKTQINPLLMVHWQEQKELIHNGVLRSAQTCCKLATLCAAAIAATIVKKLSLPSVTVMHKAMCVVMCLSLCVCVCKNTVAFSLFFVFLQCARISPTAALTSTQAPPCLSYHCCCHCCCYYYHYLREHRLPSLLPLCCVTSALLRTACTHQQH
jgi:hypothetical protein